MADVYKVNPFTGRLDNTGKSLADLVTALEPYFLRLDASNDPLTGELVITPSSGTNALKANKDITLKAGQRLVFDGS